MRELLCKMLPQELGAGGGGKGGRAASTAEVPEHVPWSTGLLLHQEILRALADGIVSGHFGHVGFDKGPPIAVTCEGNPLESTS